MPGLTIMREVLVAELRVVGEYRGPGEQLTAETLSKELPSDWVIIANRSLPTEQHDDLDLTAIGQNMIFIVENKHWGPDVEVGPGPWTVKRQPRENPTDRVSFLARKLATLLRNRVTGYPKRGRLVESFIVLSYPGVWIDWTEAGPESDMVIRLEDAAEALIQADQRMHSDLRFSRDEVIAFLDGWKKRRQVPERIGAYTINQEIAPLGRARVFAAHDDVGNFVLLRCYPMDGWGPDADPENLIRRERKAIQKLAQSRRTLESQPVFSDELHRWLVVPIVQQPLKTLPRLLSMPAAPISPTGSSPAQIVGFVADAFDGLALIHSEGVVHRGISPARIALGTDNVVKFVDFYLARVLGEETVAPSLNELADLGAPFRAPECRDWIGAANESSDLYSLALSLLWWLGGDPKASVSRHVTSERTDLRPLTELLKTCADADPLRRPALSEVISATATLRKEMGRAPA